MADDDRDKTVAPSPPPAEVEEKAIDLSHGREGVVILPTEAVGPGDLQSVIDQVSGAPMQAAPGDLGADPGATGSED
jgi:hypothetical protein